MGRENAREKRPPFESSTAQRETLARAPGRERARESGATQERRECARDGRKADNGRGGALRVRLPGRGRPQPWGKGLRELRGDSGTWRRSPSAVAKCGRTEPIPIPFPPPLFPHDPKTPPF